MTGAPEHCRLRILDVVREGGRPRVEIRTTVPDRPEAIASVRPAAGAVALMMWDEDLPLPDPELVAQLLGGPCHVWHAGLRLGQAGRPTAWNICHGRSMLSCDAAPEIESTSWKVSVRALLLRNEVVEHLGGFDPAFDTIAGAALDAGLRWTAQGALIRHVPDLLPRSVHPVPDPPPSAADGIRIARRRLGTRWGLWAIYRGLRNGSLAPRRLPATLRVLTEPMDPPGTRRDLPVPEGDIEADARVTVLIPTVGRYPYLERLLVQLGAQTVPPHEVVVVDQNPASERRDLGVVAPDLPLRVLPLLPPGQCSARNLGLQTSTGTHILFLDDDDEIPPDLIEQHLRVLAPPEISVSCGLVDDVETGPAPPSLRFRKAGDTFPTNNAMVRRTVLATTGLFDPTYDRGARADHDLGMRSYLAGNLHVYDPRPQVLHHHAPVGGLRTHGARIRTRANSRSSITKRHLRTPTDVYLGLRYHSEEQVAEDLKLSVLATLTADGGGLQRIGRFAVQALLLPSTLRHNRIVRRHGEVLLRERPEIPRLGTDP